MLVNNVWMDRFWTETVHKYTAEMRPNFVWIQFEHLLDMIGTYFRFGPRAWSYFGHNLDTCGQAKSPLTWLTSAHSTMRPLPGLSLPIVPPRLEGELPLQLGPRRGLVEHSDRVDGRHRPRPPHPGGVHGRPVPQGERLVRRRARHLDRRPGEDGGVSQLHCCGRVAASGGTGHRGSVSRGALDGDTLIATGASCAKGSQHHPVN